MVLRRRRIWDFLKYIITDDMNYVSAPGPPREAEGKWPWSGPRCAFGAALAACCAAPTVYMMSPLGKETYALCALRQMPWCVQQAWCIVEHLHVHGMTALHPL